LEFRDISRVSEAITAKRIKSVFNAQLTQVALHQKEVKVMDL